MRILLAALTGMGNEVLEALCACPVADEVLVVSRAENGSFPYYPCQPLEDACRKAGILCRLDADLDTQAGLDLMRTFAPDLLLTATYHRIVPKAVLSSTRFAVNIHPSLLPWYKGPTPTNWVVACGEAESGVSFHWLEEKIDSGPILSQYSMPITEMTDGEVRQALYALAGHQVSSLLTELATGTCQAMPKTAEGSVYPRFASERGIFLLKTGGFSRENLVRAATPYPGTQFLVSNGL